MGAKRLKVQSPRGIIDIPHAAISDCRVAHRLAALSSRCFKGRSKKTALNLAISMVDLTTLEGADSPQKIIQLCQRARAPSKSSDFESLDLSTTIPSSAPAAAVCVYPNFVRLAKQRLNKSGVKVAAVAGAFPSGQVPLSGRLKEVEFAVGEGADEIDMVISRGLFLSGNYQAVFDEVLAIKDCCGDRAHLKVIIEAGELGSYQNIKTASWLAMEAGADFIKTSTGKISSASSLDICLVMLWAIEEYYYLCGRRVGMKPAGGIKSAKQALSYLVLLKETLGSDWLTPSLFRLGASSLLGDLVRQWYRQHSGMYASPTMFPWT